ncbi:hypothetical protein [Nocardia mangyaensis]|uniref:hypothetical protein n=1 Tax=Nocardia mangyaensis TaxID=2213200 RepID=UPI001431F11B|nr:hypothetical protein [Nocardia mangyaensis]
MTGERHRRPNLGQDRLPEPLGGQIDTAQAAHPLGRVVETPGRVLIDLEFDDRAGAESFRAALATVLATPRSRAMVTGHQSWLVDLVEEYVSA